MTKDTQRGMPFRQLGASLAIALAMPATLLAQDSVATTRLQALKSLTTDTFFGTVQATDMLGLSYEARGCVVEVSESAKRGRTATAGQVLVKLDDQRTILALRTAETRLAELKAQVEERELDIQSALADDKRRQQELELTTAEFDRNSTMLGRGLINETTMEGVERRFMEARFAADRAKEAIATARAAKGRAEIALEIGKLDLQTAQLNLDVLEVTAPIDGVLVGFEASLGDCVQEGARAAQIYAPSQKSVDVFILISRLSETGPNGISDGTDVRITRVNGQACGGVITRFDTEADLENQFVKATIEVDTACAPDLFLNEAVEVEAMTAANDDTFEFPTTALTAKDTVFVVREDTLALEELKVEILQTDLRKTLARIPGGDGRLLVSDAQIDMVAGQVVVLD